MIWKIMSVSLILRVQIVKLHYQNHVFFSCNVSPTPRILQGLTLKYFFQVSGAGTGTCMFIISEHSISLRLYQCVCTFILIISFYTWICILLCYLWFYVFIISIDSNVLFLKSFLEKSTSSVFPYRKRHGKIIWNTRCFTEHYSSNYFSFFEEVLLSL